MKHYTELLRSGDELGDLGECSRRRSPGPAINGGPTPRRRGYSCETFTGSLREHFRVNGLPWASPRRRSRGLRGRREDNRRGNVRPASRSPFPHHSFNGTARQRWDGGCVPAAWRWFANLASALSWAPYATPRRRGRLWFESRCYRRASASPAPRRTTPRA